ncbi:MAG: hypothetical protein ABEJ85_04230 [Haloarculaceae archaeon]
MSTHRQRPALARFRPRKETLVWGALLVNTELVLLLAYTMLGNSRLLGLRGVIMWLFPFVWINVGIWAVVRTDPAPASARQRRLAALLAAGYFVVLAYTGGMIGPTHRTLAPRVVWTTIPPGWAPTVTYSGVGLSLTLIPYKVVGYAALAYLVYATILDAAGAAVSGVLGLVSCVSCSWPVLASILTGALGSGSALAAAVYDWSYLVSTAVFVVTVALLYWRPFGRAG